MNFVSLSRRPLDRLLPCRGLVQRLTDLREGDIVLSLAAKAVAGIDEVHRLLTAERSGVTLGIEILRGVERLQLSIIPETKREE